MKACVYDLALWTGEKMGLTRWRQHIAGEARGRVLEIGIGTGLNLPHYPNDIELTGIDPDEGFLAQARERAAKLGRSVNLLNASAEQLPFADHSFDTVIGTLVFCTIPEPEQALREVRRVLKPNGEFRSIEHVRMRNLWAARFQDLITPCWKIVGNGCHPNRDTLRTIRANGFEIKTLREHLGGLVIEIEARKANS